MIDEKTYELAYNELSRRACCKEDERLCIEKETNNIIRCNQNGLWTGFFYVDDDLTSEADRCYNENVGFNAASKIETKKRIVDICVESAKKKKIMLVEGPFDGKHYIMHSIIDNKKVMDANETVEQLAISYELNH